MPIVVALFLCACNHNQTEKNFRLLTNGISEKIQGAVVNSDFFTNAKEKPCLGCLFISADAQRSPVTEVVLSYGVWERVFHRWPEIIGSTVELDNRTAVVLGVAPPKRVPPSAGELWILMKQTS